MLRTFGPEKWYFTRPGVKIRFRCGERGDRWRNCPDTSGRKSHHGLLYSIGFYLGPRDLPTATCRSSVRNGRNAIFEQCFCNR